MRTYRIRHNGRTLIKSEAYSPYVVIKKARDKFPKLTVNLYKVEAKVKGKGWEAIMR